MPAVSEMFGDLLEPGLRKIFVDVYREKPQMMDMDTIRSMWLPFPAGDLPADGDV